MIAATLCVVGSLCARVRQAHGLGKEAFGLAVGLGGRSRRFIVMAVCLAAAIVASGLSQQASAATVTIGNGSGYLNYPTAQSTLNLQPGDTLYIDEGTYDGINLGNIAGTAQAPITVRCDPDAVFSNESVAYNSFSNLTYVVFEDFRFETYAYRCVPITGDCHDLVFRDFNFEDTGDYIFYIYDSSKVFNGTKASTFYNFTFENITVDGATNGAFITNNDWASASNLKSMLLDFEIFDCTFTNMTGTVVDLNKAFNFTVHDCTFDGLDSTGHVACVYASGYGTMYNNRFTDQWANDARIYPLKLNALGYNGSDAVNRFYNNISWEKQKYAVYEHHYSPQSVIDGSSGYLSYTSSEVYFNTMYRSRKVNYCAPLVDVYGPNLTIKHNLIIEPECDTTFDPYRNYVYILTAGAQDNIVATNNLVYSTFAASGLIDATDFVPALDSGPHDAATGTVNYITTDINGNSRYVGNAADAGAVEQQSSGNVAPTVDAGSNASITLGQGVSLDGTVSDDGLPDPPGACAMLWTKQSGPGTVTFDDDEAVDTGASFSTEGVYVLRLTADDGDETAYDEVTITVGAPTIGILTPAAGQVGASWFPLENAFDDQPTWDDENEEPVGDAASGSDAPYLSSRYGYIDFGANWADVRITATWTLYRPYSSGDQSGYAEMWWDDDIDTTNDGTSDYTLDFNSAQGVPYIGNNTQWIQDVDCSASPVTPQARYLLLKSAASMTNRAREYAIVGYSAD